VFSVASFLLILNARAASAAKAPQSTSKPQFARVFHSELAANQLRSYQVLEMAPKQCRITECLLGDRRWAVPCDAPSDETFTRLFLLRLSEPCLITDVVLDTRLPCTIIDVEVCCPQLDESQGALRSSHRFFAEFASHFV
jgi:hypothetical protein